MPKAFAVVTRALTHPDSVALLAEMTAEIGALYETGTGLRGDWTAEMFLPPSGRFLVGYFGSTPSAIGGYRRVADGLAQVHRVFVRPDLRGQGVARRLMARLETLAAEAGYTRLRLDTGYLQEAAIGLYESLGYERIPRFAPYEDDVDVRCYGKRISA